MPSLDTVLEPLLAELHEELTEAMHAAVRSMMGTARTKLKSVLEAVAAERDRGMAEVEEKRAVLEAELAAMRPIQEAQGSRVELDVGGVRFSTSLATLGSKGDNMLTAMLSGRYAVDRGEDGSWTATAGCLRTCWSTCATAWWRWRRGRLAGGRTWRCCGG